MWTISTHKKKHTLSGGKRPNPFIPRVHSNIYVRSENQAPFVCKQTSHPLLFTGTAGRISRSAHTNQPPVAAKAQAKRGPQRGRGGSDSGDTRTTANARFHTSTAAVRSYIYRGTAVYTNHSIYSGKYLQPSAVCNTSRLRTKTNEIE